MLVLSRKKNGKVVIIVPPSSVERTIEVCVVEIRGDKTRLAFDAQKDIIIHRQEVYDVIEAAKNSPPERT